MYSEASDKMIWKSKWGGEIFFLMELNTVKGYAFLFTLQCRVKLIVFLTAIRDEWCYIAMEFNSLKLSLCNVYVPKQPNPSN